MKRAAFIILNYNTAEEIISLLNSLKNQKWFSKIKIYIVDNNSQDNSIELLREYKKDIDFELIISNENLGFAKGNNLGIQKALKDGYECIIVSNPDIIIKEDSEFLDKIEKSINNDSTIALIGPSIINANNMEQNPLIKDRFDEKYIFNKKLFFYLRLDLVYYILRVYILYDFINLIKKLNKEKFLHKGETKSQYVYALNGCFLIFTPTFFKYFSGFDPNTFMFCEEIILAEKLYKKKLKSYVNSDIQVLHIGSRSVEKVNKKFREKLKFVLFNTLKSCRYFFKEVV